MKKKKIRIQFRNSCFERDNFSCVMCGKNVGKEQPENELDCHHITDRTLLPAGGYVKENGISLCGECHIKAEKFHISGGIAWEIGFHPDDLYKKINSSFDKALDASITLNEKLKKEKDDFE